MIRRDNADLRCHYVKNDLYALGISQTESPQENTVRLYDRERCICDLIRDKKQVDMQLFTQALHEYFRSKQNTRRLTEKDSRQKCAQSDWHWMKCAQRCDKEHCLLSWSMAVPFCVEILSAV